MTSSPDVGVITPNGSPWTTCPKSSETPESAASDRSTLIGTGLNLQIVSTAAHGSPRERRFWLGRRKPSGIAGHHVLLTSCSRQDDLPGTGRHGTTPDDTCGAISIFALKGSSVRCRNGLLAHTCSQTGPSLAAARTCGHHRDPPETSLSSEVRRLSDQLEEPRPVLVRESVTRPYGAYAFRTSAAVHDSAPGGTSTAFFSFRVSAMSSKDRLG